MIAKSKDPTPKADLSFDSEDFDHERYADVARRARLRLVSLRASEYKIQVRFFVDDACADDLVYSFRGAPLETAVDVESGVLGGVYEWEVRVKHKRAQALKLTCRYQVGFTGVEGVDARHARLYVEKIGRFATYPYFRSHFAMSASESGVMVPPLPSLTDRVD